ncbi:MAG: ankyrin repeat domain-containing protein [Nitrospirota bacterium]|nr:ankyrin repeat domain-containing protein [Nitrospirota bacterium]
MPFPEKIYEIRDLAALKGHAQLDMSEEGWAQELERKGLPLEGPWRFRGKWVWEWDLSALGLVILCPVMAVIFGIGMSLAVGIAISLSIGAGFFIASRKVRRTEIVVSKAGIWKNRELFIAWDEAARIVQKEYFHFGSQQKMTIWSKQGEKITVNSYYVEQYHALVLLVLGLPAQGTEYRETDAKGRPLTREEGTTAQPEQPRSETKGTAIVFEDRESRLGAKGMEFLARNFNWIYLTLVGIQILTVILNATVNPSPHIPPEVSRLIKEDQEKDRQEREEQKKLEKLRKDIAALSAERFMKKEVRGRSSSGLSGKLSALLDQRDPKRQKLRGVINKFIDEDLGNPREFAGEGILAKAAAGDLQAVKKLLQDGENPDTADQFGHTALMLAASRDHPAVAKLLLEKNADPELKMEKGITALHYASMRGSREIVRMLLTRGVDINVQDNGSNTPLMVAIRYGHAGVVDLLLDRGADIKISPRGFTHPFAIAAVSGHIETVRTLLNRHPEITRTHGREMFFGACEKGSREMVQMLLDAGVGVAVREKYSRNTPLHTAVGHGHKEVAELLLDRGADVNGPGRDRSTPLMYAGKHTEIAKLLIERGADINAKDKDNGTALMSAAAAGNAELVRELLERGADVQVIDSAGNTPLLVAARDGHTEVVQVLLEHDARANIRNNMGRTPLALAKKYGHRKIVGMLEKVLGPSTAKTGRAVERKEPKKSE